MNLEAASFFLGTGTSIYTSIAFVPQTLKIGRIGGRDLSCPLLFLYGLGGLLWLGYGIMIRARAVIAANGVAVCLVSVWIGMRWRYERLPGRRGAIATSGGRTDGSCA